MNFLRFIVSQYCLLLKIGFGSFLEIPKAIVIFFLFFIFIPYAVVFAQINNNYCASTEVFSGNMRVKNGTVGCVPFKAIAVNTDKNSSNTRYIFDYKGGAPDTYTSTRDSTYTYSKPGLYVLMQLSESNTGQPQRTCITVTVRDTTAPQFKVLPCADGTVTVSLLSHTNNQYDEYWVHWGDGESPSQLNKLITATKHHYQDIATPKTIRLQGLYTIGTCGGSNTKTIDFSAKNSIATLLQLEVLDDVTAELTIDNPNEAELELYRQEGLNPFQTTGTIIKNPKDKVKVLADTNRLHCYKLKVRDGCSTPTESNTLCISFIKAIPDLQLNTITITPYKNLTDIKKMSVSRNEQPWWTPNRTDLFKVDKEAVCGKKNCYRLQIETNTGGKVLSNIKCIDPPIGLCSSISSIFIADIFTPNSDGKNDVLEIIGDSASDATLYIFDSWGNIIFRTTSTVRQWNGTLDGKPAPIGQYFYKISLKDKLGREFSKRGVVSLLR